MNTYRRLWLLTVAGALTLTALGVHAQENSSQMEFSFIGWTNSARHQHGRRDVTANAKLMQAAQKHALEMATREFMTHSFDGTTAADRVQRLGYNFAFLAENVARNSGYDSPAKTIFDGWMKSPAHYQNIMNGQFTEVGVGVARSARGRMYVCQVFGRQMGMMPPVYAIPYAPNPGTQVPYAPLRQVGELVPNPWDSAYLIPGLGTNSVNRVHFAR